jgi:hypothetical protein
MASAETVGQRAAHRSKYSTTVATYGNAASEHAMDASAKQSPGGRGGGTRVCCNMISDTQTRYAQSRSRTTARTGVTRCQLAKAQIRRIAWQS